MDGSAPSPGPHDELIRRAVEDGISRYFAARHARVPGFIDRHFSLRGTLGVHRAAFGLDVLRAPANLLLAAPHAALKASGTVAGRLGGRRFANYAEAHSLLLRTNVSRRIEWLVCSELLELPCHYKGRDFRRDALAEAILDDPRISGLAEERLVAIGRRADDTEFRARLCEVMTSYAATRAAAAEIATSLLTLGSGAIGLKQFTPGAATLGPALAGMLAQQSAIAAFPLGSGLGGLWYSMFPVAASTALVVGVTGGLLLAAACTAAFAGLIADPIQHRTGLHARRLNRLLDALERQMRDPAAPAFAVHDHYVARLLDLFDLLGSAYRLSHG